MYTTPEEKDALLQKLTKWLGDCEKSTSETTYNDNAREDYQFYAGNQDTPEVKMELERQKRPTTTYNEVKPKIDMLVGMGNQLEGSVTLFPRTNEDSALVELMTGTVEFFREKMRQSWKENSCFEHAVKSGASWLHFWVDQEDPAIIKSQRIPGRDMHCDTDSIEFDKSDARFIFRDKWMDADDIEAAWPEYKFARDAAGNVMHTSINAVHSTTSYTPTFFNQAREKYRIVEAWFRKYEQKYSIVNPFSGQPEELFEEEFKEFTASVKRGIQLPNGDLLQKDKVPFTKRLVKVIYYAIFTADKILEVGRSVYKHNMFPYVYLEAYHDEENNAPQSVVYSMKDPQRGLNTTRRQLVFLLQQIHKGIMIHEAGAVLDIEDYEQNSSKPGYHMEVSKGGLEKVKFVTQPQISQIYLQLDQMFQQSMKDSSGIQDALLGIQTSTREPGITARMRNDASVAVLYTLFSNLKEFKYNCMKILVSNIQQFVTEPMVVRIKGQTGYELLQINSQMNPQSEGWNDITSL